jgi:hypothetical protein
MPDWQLRGALRHVGDGFTDNTDLDKMPANTVVDLGLRWNVTAKLSLNLRGDNIIIASMLSGQLTPVLILIFLESPGV